MQFWFLAKYKIHSNLREFLAEKQISGGRIFPEEILSEFQVFGGNIRHGKIIRTPISISFFPEIFLPTEKITDWKL